MKWISAAQLNVWANTNAAQQSLSELVSELARASAADSQDVRFPSGDSSSVPGYDGTIYSERGSPFVSQGISVWEFGTSEDYLAKANSDFKTRTDDPRGLKPAETTFVFCTPRPWTNPKLQITQWEAEKQASSSWKAVKVVDGARLEEWLSASPAAAARMAHRMGWRPQEGALSVDEAWERYASEFNPTLTEVAAIAARKEQAEFVTTALSGAPGAILMRYDSPDELVAFALAAIRNAEDEARKFLLSRTLVLEAEPGVQFFGRQPGLAIIAKGDVAKRAGYLGQTNPTFVPLGPDPYDTRPIAKLVRPPSSDFEDGLRSMVSEHDARKFAQVCSGSLTILQRHIPAAVRTSPTWAGNATLVAAVLAGAWDPGSDADKAIIRELAGSDTYESYEAQIRALAGGHDAPIDKVGNIWRVRAPFDAIIHLAEHVDAGVRARFKAVAIRILSELDPAVVTPNDEAFDNAEKFTHSDWLRKGTARTLLHFAILTSQATIPGVSVAPADFVDGIVRDIPGLATDYRILASLKSECAVLMEAAPGPLLDALEQLLKGDGAALSPIFEERGKWSPRAYHTGLLWGLERLAWDPTRLTQAARLLTRMAAIDPGGNLTNRPLNSLLEIFLPWHPSTNASQQQRLQTIDVILKENEGVGWALLLKLIDSNRSFAQSTDRPHFRDSGASTRERVTYASVAEERRGLGDLAVLVAGHSPERLAELVDELPSLHPEARKRAITAIDETFAALSDERRRAIWGALNRLVATHRRHGDAEWALPPAEVELIAGLAVRLEPKDTIDQLLILFEETWPTAWEDDEDDEDEESDKERDDGARGFQRAHNRLDRRRVQAVEELVEESGLGGLLELASKVGIPAYVASAFVDGAVEIEQVSVALNLALQTEGVSQEFFASLSARALHKFGEAWKDQILNRQLEPSQIALLAAAWPDDPVTWNWIESRGNEADDAYWRIKGPWYLTDDDEALQERAARKFLAVGRATAGLITVQKAARQLPPSLIFSLLDGAIPEINGFADGPSSMLIHSIQETFDALRSRADVDQAELAQREYAYLPLWRFQEGGLAIHKVMASSPEFFVSVLSDVFRAKGAEDTGGTDETKRRAEVGYQLLSSFTALPGLTYLDSEGVEQEPKRSTRRRHRGADNAPPGAPQLDVETLTAWIDRARALAHEGGRGEVGDIYIGHLFAHGPANPETGSWPHPVISAQIERLESEEVENGIATERFNMRGVFSKAMFEGGEQERELAKQLKDWALAASVYPRTTSLLLRLAEGYERDAEREDKRAEEDRARY